MPVIYAEFPQTRPVYQPLITSLPEKVVALQPNIDDALMEGALVLDEMRSLKTALKQNLSREERKQTLTDRRFVQLQLEKTFSQLTPQQQAFALRLSHCLYLGTEEAN